MRVNTVTAARKPRKEGKEMPTCEACRLPIQIGDSYNWIKSRYGPKRSRHANCPQFKPSDMTGAKMATALVAQEDAAEALDAMSVEDYMEDVSEDGGFTFNADTLLADIDNILNEAAGGAQECLDDYQEGLDNMPYQLQDGTTGQEIQEKIDMLEAWIDELGSFQSNEDVSDYDTPQEFVDAATEEARDILDRLEA